MKELEIKRGIRLSPYTTFKIGGEAEYFAIAKSEAALRALAGNARERAMSVTILGGGSNVLISDEGISGLVVKVEIEGIEYEAAADSDDVIVTAGAGVAWDELVLKTTEENLWGLENLSGIPGTVGGAVVQNINAYGVTIADLVEEVTAFNLKTEEVKSFAPRKCEFEYRNSFFKRKGAGKDYVITRVKLRLARGKRLHAEYRSSSQSIDAYLRGRNITEPAPNDMREAILHIRSKIGMLEGMYKSAGSFFKNPIVRKEVFDNVLRVVEKEHADVAKKFEPWHWNVGGDQEKISAAFLMECTSYNKTDFAGKNYNGAVGISPVHTLSIVNQGQARASDVRDFAKKISDTVKEKFGIEFESEVCLL